MIGETLYQLDPHRRERWTPISVTGETPTSWICGGYLEISKKTLTYRPRWGKGRLYTAADRERWELIRATRPRLIALIEQADDDTLLRYAALLDAVS